MYHTDVDLVKESIDHGTVKANDIRILTSKSIQGIDLLTLYPNIEEIHCPMICSFSSSSLLYSVIESRHKLRVLQLVIVADDIQSDVGRGVKDSRFSLKPDDSDAMMNVVIPRLIRKLGDRMRYLCLVFNVVDSNKQQYLISMDRGTLYCVRKTNESIIETPKVRKIFTAYSSIGCLENIITDGGSDYPVSNDLSLQCLSIISLNDHTKTQTSQLSALIERTRVVNIEYNSNTFRERYFYSGLLKTAQTLERIEAIVPSRDIEELIENNPMLYEIHSVALTNDDTEEIIKLLDLYQYRDISYKIHYNKEELVRKLRGKGDIILIDIMKHLNSV